MKKISRFILGVFFGAFLGSSIVILLAPESGDETRSALSSRFNDLVKQIKAAVSDRKTELMGEIEKYKDTAA